MTIKCSFCDADRDKVRHIIVRERSKTDLAAICDECLVACITVLFKKADVHTIRDNPE